jgi:protein-arginine kinase activator protein McsA
MRKGGGEAMFKCEICKKNKAIFDVPIGEGGDEGIRLCKACRDKMEVRQAYEEERLKEEGLE